MRALVQNLALAAASLLLLLGIVEGAARLVGAPGLTLHPTSSNCLDRDPALGYVLRPSCTGVLHGTPLRTNDVGLRGGPVATDDATRILAVGDSSTFGWQVPEDQSYPLQLETRLDALYGKGRYHVLNAGIPGYTSHHGIGALERYGPTLHPGIVIIAFGYNDSIRQGDVEEQLRANSGWVRLLAADDFLLTHSIFYQWVRHILARGVDRSAAAPRVSPERFAQNLRTMVERTRALGATPILLCFPADGRVFQDDELTRWMGRYIDAFAAVSTELDVPMLVFRGSRLDNIHPDTNGYDWLVTDLVELMTAKHVLPPPPAR